MTEAERIRNFTAEAVVIDDGFLPARLEMIQENHWAALRASENEAQWTPLKTKYFPDIDRPVHLKRNESALKDAWAQYELNPEEFAVLDPIFFHVRASRTIDVRPLNPMIKFLEEEVGLKLMKHPDIASAEEDIKRCKLIFLDFYLDKDKTTPSDIIEDIKAYGDLFSSPIKVGDEVHGRVVFLISTALPGQDDLENFRRATGLKGAFFKPAPKRSLTREWLQKELLAKIGRYDDLRKWVSFLETFSTQIRVVSDALRAEIDSLELHDLSILDTLRLQTDSEQLGDYLSWIFSEALSARIRQSAPMVNAGHIVDQIGGTPFQGMLMPKQVLFALYSDIAFAIPNNDAEKLKVRFGDVYSPLLPVTAAKDSEKAVGSGSEEIIASDKISVACAQTVSVAGQQKDDSGGKDRARGIPDTAVIGVENNKVPSTLAKHSNELILVISPACDLQRCKSDYEVLCVRGCVIKQVSNLADLHSHQVVYGKDEDVFKHLLRQRVDGADSYYVVEWKPKRVTVLPVSELTNSEKYFKRARLNELFGQEMKEEALRQVSRVGVPVDPSYSSALSAVVQIKRGKKSYLTKEAPDDEFVSGILISANENNAAVIMLSEEFLKFLEEIVEGWDTSSLPLDDKILAALKSLRDEGAKGVKLNSSQACEFVGGFKVRLAQEYQRGVKPTGNEIIFFPRGRVIESPDMASSTKPVLESTTQGDSESETSAPE